MLLAALGFFDITAALSELSCYDVAAGKRVAPWIGGEAVFAVAAACETDLLGKLQAVWSLAVVTIAISVSLIANRSRKPWSDH
jgi:hypothetical protein